MKNVLLGGFLVGTLVGCSSTPEVLPPGERVAVEPVDEWCGIVMPVPVQTAGRALIEGGAEFHYGQCEPYASDQEAEDSALESDSNRSTSESAETDLPDITALLGLVSDEQAEKLQRYYLYAVNDPTPDNVAIYERLHQHLTEQTASN